MKKLLVLLVVSLLIIPLAACHRCEYSQVRNIGNAYDVNPAELLQKLNVIFAGPDENKRCGGTLIVHCGKLRVLTAAHCVMDENKMPFEYGFVYEGEEKYRVNIVDYRRGYDLALLEPTDKLPLATLAAPVGTVAKLGETIWVIGFGAGVEDSVTKGIVSKLDQENWSGVKNNQLDVTAFYGNSGGGVFNESLELIGVVVQIGPGGPLDGWIFAVRPIQINEFLGEMICG